jgi:hypothetical protein
MSRRRKKEKIIQVPISPYRNPCICTLPEIAILILIILQFSNRGKDNRRGKDEIPQISNEVLFIIALYFLSCIQCNYRYPSPNINLHLIKKR